MISFNFSKSLASEPYRAMHATNHNKDLTYKIVLYILAPTGLRPLYTGPPNIQYIYYKIDWEIIFSHQ